MGPTCLTCKSQRSRVNFFHAWYDNYGIQSSIVCTLAGKPCRKKLNFERSPLIGQIGLANNAMSKITIINLIVLCLICMTLRTVSFKVHTRGPHDWKLYESVHVHGVPLCVP